MTRGARQRTRLVLAPCLESRQIVETPCGPSLGLRKMDTPLMHNHDYYSTNDQDRVDRIAIIDFPQKVELYSKTTVIPRPRASRCYGGAAYP